MIGAKGDCSPAPRARPGARALEELAQIPRGERRCISWYGENRPLPGGGVKKSVYGLSVDRAFEALSGPSKALPPHFVAVQVRPAST
jgi:hypothetical protein